MLKQLYHFLNPKFQNLFLEYKINFKPRYGYGLPPHKKLYEIINGYRNNYSTLLHEALNYIEEFQKIKKMKEEKDPFKPVYNNEYLPGLDIIVLYTIISTFKPEKYIEIGSGNSTKVAYKAIKDKQLNTKIISIDPSPRAEIDKLADTIIREPLEKINYEFIFSLKENDILFMDGYHRILPNSDVTVFFLEILPFIPSGVIVHIHDIYLPYDYPQFMCNRFYSEQYGLAIYLLTNHEKFKPLLPNYFISQDNELKKIIEPIWDHPNLNGVERHGGSFWLIVR